MTGPLDSPGFWLHRSALAWTADLGRRLAPLDLTPTQLTLLAATSWLTREHPVSQQEIASFAGSDRMMASRILRVLEARGLLVRKPDPDSARSLLLGITPAGRALVLLAVKCAAESDAAMFGTEADAWRHQLEPLASRAPKAT